MKILLFQESILTSLLKNEIHLSNCWEYCTFRSVAFTSPCFKSEGIALVTPPLGSRWIDAGTWRIHRDGSRCVPAKRAIALIETGDVTNLIVQLLAQLIKNMLSLWCWWSCRFFTSMNFIHLRFFSLKIIRPGANRIVMLHRIHPCIQGWFYKDGGYFYRSVRIITLTFFLLWSFTRVIPNPNGRMIHPWQWGTMEGWNWTWNIYWITECLHLYVYSINFCGE